MRRQVSRNNVGDGGMRNGKVQIIVAYQNF